MPGHARTSAMTCAARSTTRGRSCRIYPAEVNPFVPLVPDGKQCTPDAWQQAPFVRGGTIVDEHRALACGERTETPLRARLCAMLGIDTAAVATKGSPSMRRRLPRCSPR